MRSRPTGLRLVRPAQAVATPIEPDPSPRRKHGIRPPVVIALGAAAAAVDGIGYWIPTPWGDEMATRSAAERSLEQLLHLVVSDVDAVHALYYLAVHALVLLGGTSTAVLRLLSVLSVGVAASGVAVLGGRLGDARLGITAAIVFATTPQVGWAATEARSSATVMAVSVWLTVLLLAAVGSSRCRLWILFAIAGAAAIALNVYLLLLLVSLQLSLALSPRWRSALRPGLLATGAAAIGASPVLVLSAVQAAQVGWLPRFQAGTVRQVVEHQWFGDSIGFTVLAWAAMAAGGVVVARSRQRILGRGPLVLLVLAAFLPTAVLVMATIALHPLYAPRYAVMSLPFVAVLIALPLTALDRPWRTAALLAIVLAAVPTFVAQRATDAKGVAWAELAAALAERAPTGRPIWIVDDGGLPYFRIFEEAELQDHPDIALVESHRTNGRLLDTVRSVSRTASEAARFRAITVVAVRSGWERSVWFERLAADGFEPTSTTAVGEDVVIELERVPLHG